jgi:hypothetical protein
MTARSDSANVAGACRPILEDFGGKASGQAGDRLPPLQTGQWIVVNHSYVSKESGLTFRLAVLPDCRSAETWAAGMRALKARESTSAAYDKLDTVRGKVVEVFNASEQDLGQMDSDGRIEGELVGMARHNGLAAQSDSGEELDGEESEESDGEEADGASEPGGEESDGEPEESESEESESEESESEESDEADADGEEADGEAADDSEASGGGASEPDAEDYVFARCKGCFRKRQCSLDDSERPFCVPCWEAGKADG